MKAVAAIMTGPMEAIESIGQVHGIAGAGNDHHCKEDEDKAGQNQTELLCADEGEEYFRGQQSGLLVHQGPQDPTGDQEFQKQLVAPWKPFRIAVANFEIVVDETDDGKTDSNGQCSPHERIRPVRPENGGHHHSKDNQRAAHGRRARLTIVRLWPILAHHLSNLP